jgi:hypothetical protein
MKENEEEQLALAEEVDSDDDNGNEADDEEAEAKEREGKLNRILDQDTGWDLSDLEGALDRGLLDWDDIFALHDQGEITDEELDYLFGCSPDEIEANKMDVRSSETEKTE